MNKETIIKEAVAQEIPLTFLFKEDYEYDVENDNSLIPTCEKDTMIDGTHSDTI